MVIIKSYLQKRSFRGNFICEEKNRAKFADFGKFSRLQEWFSQPWFEKTT